MTLTEKNSLLTLILKKIYVLIYKLLEEAKIAIKLDIPMFMNKDGKVVDKDKAFGLKCTVKVVNPQYFLFVDEVGLNMS